MGPRASTSAPRWLPTSYDEMVRGIGDDLGQRQVKAASATGPVSMDTQKQVPPACAALHGDDEHVLTARGVAGIGVSAAEQDPIQDPHGMQLAGAGAEKRVARRAARRLLHLCQCTLLVDARFEHRDLGGQLVALERVRAHGVAEQRRIAAGHQPVAPAVLLIGPSDGQVAGRRDLVVDDGAVAHGGADERVAAIAERIEKRVEVGTCDHVPAGDRRRHRVLLNRSWRRKCASVDPMPPRTGAAERSRSGDRRDIRGIRGGGEGKPRCG